MKLAAKLQLPSDAVTQTFFCVGRRGSGKTHTASVLAEGMLDDGHQIVVIDPVGVWWGLRSHYEVVILGGEYGDLPVEPAGGTAIADFLIHEKMPVIVDVSQFFESDMVRLVADLGSHFYTKTDRTPIHWFIDECDEFAPQGGQATGGNIPKCMGAIQRLVRRGRARGIGATVITQRCAVINKSVSSQTECLLAHQTTSPHDMDAVDSWIKTQGTKEERNDILSQLPKLQPGECFAYSPAWLGELKRIKVRKRRSRDSSSTPEPGARPTRKKSLIEVDLENLSTSMKKAIEAAQENDPKLLKKRIKELESQLAGKGAKEIDALIRNLSESESAISELQSRLRQIHQTSDITSELSRQETLSARRTADPAKRTNGSTRRSSSTAKRNPSSSPLLAVSSDADLTSSQFRILRSLYWLDNEDRTPVKVAFFAGYTVNGHFNNQMSALRRMGLADGWTITDLGLTKIPDSVDPKPTGRELRQWLSDKLSGPEMKVLSVLCDAEGKRMQPSELASSAGYTVNGHFNNILGKLRRLQIAEGTAREGIRANSVFFD